MTIIKLYSQHETYCSPQWQGFEVHYSPPNSAEVKNSEVTTPFPLYLHDVVLN